MRHEWVFTAGKLARTERNLEGRSAVSVSLSLSLLTLIFTLMVLPIAIGLPTRIRPQKAPIANFSTRCSRGACLPFLHGHNYAPS